MKTKGNLLIILFVLVLTHTALGVTGDVNNDNAVTIIDALMTAQYYVGLTVLNFNASNADVNSDTVINIVDALIMAQIYVGLITPPPQPTSTPAKTLTKTPTATPTITTGAGDLIVAQDGSGNYSRVQDAINAAPSNRTTWYTIYIKKGTYREVVTVPAEKPYLKLVGENANTTVIVYNNCSSSVGSTSGSSSSFFKAKNFIARQLTFANDFDYDNSTVANKQAVAAEPMADRQVFVNCRFTGHQDTLYLRTTARMYFKSCFIQGNVDFIFGDSTGVFDQCEINSLNRSGSCISAPSTLAATAYGLIFLNCALTAAAGLGSNQVYLGRPWHPSSSGNSLSSCAVYLYCIMGAHIKTDGWTSMSGVYPDTERMYEYRNTGAGAVINSSRRQLTASQAADYAVSNILKGSDNWDPVSWAN